MALSAEQARHTENVFHIALRGSEGRIILSPPKARNFWVCSKFGCVRSLGLFDSNDSGF